MEVYRALHAFYAPHNARLEVLLGTTFDHWHLDEELDKAILCPES